MSNDLPASTLRTSCFSSQATDPASSARAGVLRLPHATLETPVFMPVGTRASVRALTSEEVWGLGYKLILGNTYHLLLRPGPEVMAELGGLRRFMNWPGAILTDSGGFQVFSLAKLVKIREDGVQFASHLDGTRFTLTPELSSDVQAALGSDIVMAMDECVRYPAEPKYLQQATERSYRWTRRSLERFRERGPIDNRFFGIVQGGCDPNLRRWSAEQIVALDCDGYAIGGLSVGEPRELCLATLDSTVPHLPADRPRYLMGVGTLADLLDGVRRGIDMFDCVLPTRLGRHGRAVLPQGHLNLLNARFRRDASPIDPSCRCNTCRQHTRAYLHHLFHAQELTALRLTTHHNLWVYARFMEGIREAIRGGTLADFATSFAAAANGEPASPS
ncbi:MAG: tRNA guanosine(34) transglycosylase Tgt [Candidatus Riflebacteria bacterium]|nr:tRNA guanosine(34) transglycosylase Tgt [Candidatus Riflebacteria bacterium]